LSKFGYFKTHEKAFAPQYSTEQASCFDLCACLIPGTGIAGVTRFNEKVWSESVVSETSSITLYSRDRMLIPTGLIFTIPDGYSIRIHPRSGLSFKNGIQLANCEGVIDSDYYHETFVSLVNVSDIPFTIKHGDRIAQAELVRDTRASFHEIFEKPLPKSDRTGGFGSTGLNGETTAK
jgi:dUTP pyrophosphatase